MKTASMSTGAFNRIIQATKAFCSKNNKNEKYHYIRLEFHSETSEVVAVAVDGFRMSVEHALAQSEEDFAVYVKSNISLPKNTEVYFELIGNEVFIRCDGFIFGYTQPVGDFLDWEKVIPDGEPKFKIAFNGDYLLSALQAAKVSSNAGFKTPVVLEFRGSIEPIILRTNKNDVKMVLPIRTRDF